MQTKVAALNPFIGGLNTEITQVTEAQQFTSDELNCQLLKDGTRARRYGIGREDNGVGLVTTYKTALDWDNWMLDSSEQVIKKTTVGDYSFTITEDGYYYVVIVGGGGGGGQTHGENRDKDGGVGASAILKVFLNAGEYTGTVGAGGAGTTRNNKGNPGGATTLVGSSVYITAGGGIGRDGYREGSGGGVAGSLSIVSSSNIKVIDRTEDGEEKYTSFIDNTTTGPGAGGESNNSTSEARAGTAGKPGMICVIAVQYSDPTTYETPLGAVKGYYWNNYNKKGADCLVVQQGHVLNFYTSSRPFSDGFICNTDISEFIIDQQNFDVNKLKFNSGNGYLVCVSEYSKPFYVYFTGESAVDTVEIELKVRDLKGIVETGTAVDDEPTTLTDIHKYNLLNQGWENSKITSYHTDKNKYPSNSQIWYVGKDTNADFQPSLLAKAYFGNTPAPKGHYVLNFNDIDRSEASGITGLPAGEAHGYPVDVIFNAGRFFYLADSHVLFSQVILEDITNIDKCYQDADPTSEQISDIIDTDGGSINFQEIGKGVALERFPLGVLVFGKKSVYSITSSAGTNFTAAEYGENLVINIGAYSKGSIVNADEIVYFWAPQGIYAISVDEVSGTSAVATCVSDTTIKTWYDALPNFSKENCQGVYDYSNRKLIWHYPTDENHLENLDGSLELYLNSNAFLPGKLSEGGYLLDSVYLNYPSKFTPAISLWAGNDEIYAEDYEVTVSSAGAEYDENSSVTYLGYSLETGKIIFCEYNERDYLDWDKSGFKSYAVSFPINTGTTYLKKYVPQIQPYFVRTEEAKLRDGEYIAPSSCYVRFRWNWSRNGESDRWDISQQAYWPNVANFTDFKYVNSKIRVRGRGEAFQICLESDGEKDFRLAGINVLTRTE